MLFSSSLLPDVFERAFAARPTEPIWEWADENVWLEGNEAAEPGPYRSAKTPWARRLQDIWQNPAMPFWDWDAGRYVWIPVKEFNGMKSSQSGYTEGVLNGIRHDAQFEPRNCIYTVDTRETARDISNRLLPSLEKLDGNIFTGDDDDVGTFVMRLWAMDIWFQGSFSMGKFASKMAPRTVSDESEEQGTDRTDTSTDTALKSRKKTADTGLHVAICKPKRKKGPIHKGYLRGNREQFMFRCPHCAYLQPFTMFRNEDAQDPETTPFSEEVVEVRDEQTGALRATLPVPLPRGQVRKLVTGRLVFDHCKDLLGTWDKLRITRETFYECGKCRGRIDEAEHKPALCAAAIWMPTAIGDPGIVSQQISDLYSTDANSAWGQIVLEFLQAKREGRKELQGFYNHRLGLPWSDEVNKTAESDIRANIAGRTLYRVDAPSERGDMSRQIFDRLDAAEAAVAALRSRGFECDIVPSVCPPYKRGTIPCTPHGFILGADVGGNYAKWAVGILLANLEDIAVVDWGHELDPDVVAELMTRHRWPCADGQEYTLRGGFMDAKHRKLDCLKACLSVPGRRLMPTAGLGGTAARSIKVFAATLVQGFEREGLRRLDYNDREAKDEMYIVRIKKKHRRIFFPIDVEEDPEFVAELCAEELIEDDRGQTIWNPFPGANHYGDAVKDIINGVRYLTRRVAAPPK